MTTKEYEIVVVGGGSAEIVSANVSAALGVRTALEDEEGQGLVKTVADRRGRVLGAHTLGPRPGELIHEFVLAIRHGLSVRALADTIHVYPTLSMANQRAAQRYYQALAEQPLFSKALQLYLWISRKPMKD